MNKNHLIETVCVPTSFRPGDIISLNDEQTRKHAHARTHTSSSQLLSTHTRWGTATGQYIVLAVIIIMMAFIIIFSMALCVPTLLIFYLSL